MLAQQTAESLTIQQKLDQIILPTVQFQNATIEEALEYLRVKSREVDKDNSPPPPTGVSFVLNKADGSRASTISLDLKDVPLGVVLVYCVELAGVKYRVDAHAVMIAASFETKFAPPAIGNADAIILPTVQFSGATLDEAAEVGQCKLTTDGHSYIFTPQQAK